MKANIENFTFTEDPFCLDNHFSSSVNSTSSMDYYSINKKSNFGTILLYILGICGLIIGGIWLYIKFSGDQKEENVIHDDELNGKDLGGLIH